MITVITYDSIIDRHYKLLLIASGYKIKLKIVRSAFYS